MPVKALLDTSADPVRDGGWLDSTRSARARTSSVARHQCQSN